MQPLMQSLVLMQSTDFVDPLEYENWPYVVL